MEPGAKLRPIQRRIDVLQRIARLAIAAPRRIVAIAILVMIGAAIFGIPVAKSLSAGGFQDPGSESAKATQLLNDKFGQGDMQLLITVSAPAGATSATFPAGGPATAGFGGGGGPGGLLGLRSGSSGGFGPSGSGGLGQTGRGKLNGSHRPNNNGWKRRWPSRGERRRPDRECRSGACYAHRRCGCWL